MKQIIKEAIEQLVEDSDSNILAKNGSVTICKVNGTDRVTKKPTKHVEIHGAGKKTRLITSVNPKWDDDKIISHLKDVHGDKLKGFTWLNESEAPVTNQTISTSLHNSISSLGLEGPYKAVTHGGDPMLKSVHYLGKKESNISLDDIHNALLMHGFLEGAGSPTQGHSDGLGGWFVHRSYYHPKDNRRISVQSNPFEPISVCHTNP